MQSPRIRPLPAPCGRPPAKRQRGGAIILEFILAMPVLFIANLAIFEFGFLALVLQAGTTAVIEATREGSKQFSTGLTFDNNAVGDTSPVANDDIADRIALAAEQYLAVHGLEVRQIGVSDDATKANVRLVIQRGALTANRGDATLAAPLTGTGPASTEIVVTLAFRLVDSADPAGPDNPVPDWLRTFGFSLQNYNFVLSSRATLE